MKRSFPLTITNFIGYPLAVRLRQSCQILKSIIPILFLSGAKICHFGHLCKFCANFNSVFVRVCTEFAQDLHTYSRIIPKNPNLLVLCEHRKRGPKEPLNCLIFRKSDRRDSNPRPSAWEANALPTEPLSRDLQCKSTQIW